MLHAYFQMHFRMREQQPGWLTTQATTYLIDLLDFMVKFLMHILCSEYEKNFFMFFMANEFQV